MGFRFPIKFSKKSDVIDMTKNKTREKPEVTVSTSASETPAEENQETGIEMVSEPMVEKKEKSLVDRLFEKLSSLEQRIGLMELKVDRLERTNSIKE